MYIHDNENKQKITRTEWKSDKIVWLYLYEAQREKQIFCATTQKVVLLTSKQVADGERL